MKSYIFRSLSLYLYNDNKIKAEYCFFSGQEPCRLGILIVSFTPLTLILEHDQSQKLMEGDPPEDRLVLSELLSEGALTIFRRITNTMNEKQLWNELPNGISSKGNAFFLRIRVAQINPVNDVPKKETKSVGQGRRGTVPNIFRGQTSVS